MSANKVKIKTHLDLSSYAGVHLFVTKNGGVQQMDLRYNFCKAIQILTAIFEQTRLQKYTNIQSIHEDTLICKHRIRAIVKILKQGGILAGESHHVWFEKDPNKLTYREVKQALGKEEVYMYYQSKDIEERKVKPFKKRIAEKLAEVEETIDCYWEHLTIAGFQNDVKSLYKVAS